MTVSQRTTNHPYSDCQPEDNQSFRRWLSARGQPVMHTVTVRHMTCNKSSIQWLSASEQPTSHAMTVSQRATNHPYSNCQSEDNQSSIHWLSARGLATRNSLPSQVPIIYISTQLIRSPLVLRVAMAHWRRDTVKEPNTQHDLETGIFSPWVGELRNSSQLS